MARGTARPLALGLCWFASVALLAWVGVKTSLAGLNSDGAVYLLLADALSPWRANDADFALDLFGRYPFPPLLPALLAVTGGGSATPAWNYAIDAALQAAGVAAALAWARRAGAAWPLALCASALLALTPVGLFTAMGVFSEPLYLALSFSAFALVATPARNPRTWRAAAALLGLAALARSVGLFAALALVAAWAWRGRRAGGLWVPTLAFAPTLAWQACKALAGWRGSYTEALFAGGLAQVLPDLAAQLGVNLRAIAYHAPRTLDLLGGDLAAWTCALLTPLVLLGWWRRVVTGAPDALYVALYAAVIVVWPFPNHYPRFLLVLLPLLATCAGLGLAALLGRVGASRWTGAAHGALALVLAAVIAPSAVQVLGSVARAADARDALHTRLAAWYEADSAAAADARVSYGLRVLDAMAALDAHVPADACVSATMPEMVMLHARRLAVKPPGADADDATLAAALTRCPYVLLLRATAFPDREYPFYYPLARLPRDLDVLYSMPLTPGAEGGEALALLVRARAAVAAPSRSAGQAN
ncbi:MAG: hypothetical protein AB7P42_17485 [Gammaproteobacteria bacterium]